MLIRYICVYRSGMAFRIHVPPSCVNTPACIGRVLLVLLVHVLYLGCKVCQFVLEETKTILFSEKALRYLVPHSDLNLCCVCSDNPTYTCAGFRRTLCGTCGRPLRSARLSQVECVWNVMAHAQKPDFVSRRNGRVHLNRRGRQFNRLLTAEVCASTAVMLDTPSSEIVWRVLATHSIRQFPLHFPSHASPCTTTFQLAYNTLAVVLSDVTWVLILLPRDWEYLQLTLDWIENSLNISYYKYFYYPTNALSI